MVILYMVKKVQKTLEFNHEVLNGFSDRDSSARLFVEI